MSEKRSMLLSRFKALFPDIYKDGMTVSEIDGTLVINPDPGKRVAKYYFKFISERKWELKHE